MGRLYPSELNNNHRPWQPLFFHMIWSSSHEISHHIMEWITLSCYFATSLFQHLTIYSSGIIPSFELDNLFTVHFLSPNLYLRPFLPASQFCLSLLFQRSPSKPPFHQRTVPWYHSTKTTSIIVLSAGLFQGKPLSRVSTRTSFKGLYKNLFRGIRVCQKSHHSAISVKNHIFTGTVSSQEPYLQPTISPNLHVKVPIS